MPGQARAWMPESRGGYSCPLPVPVTVIRAPRRRVVIQLTAPTSRRDEPTPAAEG